MSKVKTFFVCSECGGTAPKWLGKCPHCNEWNCLVETAVEPAASSSARHQAWSETSATVVPLRAVTGQVHLRHLTGLAEFDRVLGGGLVKGSVVLLGGDPGIGKSTLLLQAMAHMAGRGLKTLYATGEESAEQTKLRADRLGFSDTDILLFAENDLQRILAVIASEAPNVVVVDSIQTLYSAELQSAPGSVAQVRECAAQLTRLAKTKGVCVVLVGHVTKEGSLAGPRVLEHMVDTVLYFEGDPGDSFRMIRTMKNRFGSAMELGVFSMSESGLEEVSNPSSMFLTAHDGPVAGVSVFAALEGTRPYLVEIQALVEDSASPNPKRAGTGLDASRLQLLLAVLNKHAGIAAFDQNVYLKVVGGVKLSEPAADLCALLSVYSSLTDKPIDARTVIVGEVGLAGEVRAVRDIDTRLKEAAKLGYTTAVIPAANRPKFTSETLKVLKVARVDQALAALREIRDAA